MGLLFLHLRNPFFFSCPLSCSSALLFLPRFNEVSVLTFSSGCLVRFSVMLTGLLSHPHFLRTVLNKSIRQQHLFSRVKDLARSTRHAGKNSWRGQPRHYALTQPPHICIIYHFLSNLHHSFNNSNHYS